MSLGDILMAVFFAGMLLLWVRASRKMGVG
jgi:hypothetical protein